MKSSVRRWSVAFASAVILFAILVRTISIGDRPVHHDEAIHALTSWQLFRGGGYGYSPMTHGPLLYYLIAASYKIFGVSDSSARLPSALAGSLLVILLMLQWRNYVSLKSRLAMGFLVATSPLLIYFSRFARHDIICLVFSAVLFSSVAAYMSSMKQRHVVVALCAVGFAMATHELTLITCAVLVISLAWSLAVAPARAKVYFGRITSSWDTVACGIALMFVILAVFYTSFGSSPQSFLLLMPDPTNPDTALGYWISQHSVHRGSQPAYYYVFLIVLYESVLVLAGFGWALLNLFSRRPILRFVSAWTVLTFVCFSWAGERMPWLSIHILLPAIVCCGFLLDSIKISRKSRSFRISLGVFSAQMCWVLVNAARLSYVWGDDPREMAVFVQTDSITKRLALPLNRKGCIVGVDTELTWPLTWYLRDAEMRQISNSMELKNELGNSHSKMDAIFVTPRMLAATHLKEASFSPHELPFRKWWVPPSGVPSARHLLEYYFERKPWGREGAFLMDVFYKDHSRSRLSTWSAYRR